MAALFSKKRKGKTVVESSNEAPRFKTPFHEAHFKGKLSARKVLPELAIDYNDEILSPCAMQIKTRKWEKLTSPLPAVSHNLVKEFYANAWEPDKAKRKSYTYTTMVQEKDISFAPSNIKRVLRLRKDPLPNAASYEERKANKDYRLEEVLECLCLEGREWDLMRLSKLAVESMISQPGLNKLLRVPAVTGSILLPPGPNALLLVLTMVNLVL
ncbi:hypothetical protein PIB30_081485 [Stylosanthes scabra]|uniref:Putative plant transposon protein domain-containing protein n=1 Tax=Stylosanthes scabra TaxID=79078 RepID=A0ABU6UQJ8_9FABA|nr:hypothetical protein [Stylosanthes scabra]